MPVPDFCFGFRPHVTATLSLAHFKQKLRDSLLFILHDITQIDMKVAIRNVYGVNSSLKGSNLQVLEDHNILYSIGHEAVILNPETKEQTFITSSNSTISKGISALTYNSTRKLIAIAERIKVPGLVTLYDSNTLKKKKILNFPATEISEISSISFSFDGKLIITQSKYPDCTLCLWNIEKTATIISSSRTAVSDELGVNQISFSPYDSSVIIVIGRSILKLYRIQDNQLRATTLKRDNINYNTHCWLSAEVLLVGSDNGDIYLIENFEFKGNIISAKDNNYSENKRPLSVHALFSLSKMGFVSSHTDGVINVWDGYDNNKEHKTAKIPIIYGSACSFNLINMDTLLISTTSNQLLSFSLGSLDQSVEYQVFEPLLTSFHEPNNKGDASITCIGTSLWKPTIVLTGGRDLSLRAWNIVDKRVEVLVRLSEEPTLLSVHPSGLFVAVALETKLKLYSILLDSFQLIHQFPVKAAACLSFSRSGHLLAAVGGSTIHIYDIYSGALVDSLRGHNNRVKQVTWNRTDDQLMSYGVDGTVMTWTIYPGVCVKEYNLPTTVVSTINCLSYTGSSDLSVLYCGTQDLKVRRVQLDGADGTVGGGNKDGDDETASVASHTELSTVNSRSVITTAVDKNSFNVAELEVPSAASLLLYDEAHRMLLMAGSGGNLLVASSLLDASFTSHCLHTSPITAMCMSYDGTTLFTGDNNGTLVISTLTPLDTAVQGKGKPGNTRNTALTSGPNNTNNTTNNNNDNQAYILTDEILINLSDLTKLQQQKIELNKRIKEITYNNNNILINYDIDNEKKMNIKMKDNYDELHFEKDEYNNIYNNKTQLILSNTNNIQIETNKQTQALNNLITKYTNKIHTENQRLVYLGEEIVQIETTNKAELSRILAENKAIIESTISDFEDKLSIQFILQKALQEEKANMQVR